MPDKKKYDDELLVGLIARGHLTYAEIANRVGISDRMVSRIARGRGRPDLQSRLNAAAREHLNEQRRKAAGAARRPAGDLPAPAKHHRKKYDDELLVALIAVGELPYAEIGRRVGISREMVCRIASGRGRPELSRRIGELIRVRRTSTRRLAAKWLKSLLSQHIRDGMADSSEMARKCREYVINKFLDDRVEDEGGESDDARRPMLPMRSMTELSPKLKAAVLKELGGPEMGPEDYAEAGEDYPGTPEDSSGSPRDKPVDRDS